jgi:hypothetical protein
MKPEVEVVYHGKDQAALQDAYRLLAQFFVEARREEAGEAGEVK